MSEKPANIEVIPYREIHMRHMAEKKRTMRNTGEFYRYCAEKRPLATEDQGTHRESYYDFEGTVFIPTATSTEKGDTLPPDAQPVEVPKERTAHEKMIESLNDKTDIDWDEYNGIRKRRQSMVF